VLYPFNFQLMDFRAESAAHLLSGSRKIDDHAARVNHIDFEAVGSEPMRHLFQVFFRYAKSVSKFVRANPIVKVRGIRVVERVNELLDRFLLLGRAAQLQQHVLHGEVIFHLPTIVSLAGLGMSVAPQSDQIALIDVAGNAGSRVPAHVNGLRICELDRANEGQGN
jgi:hypothetical protein